MKAVSAIFFFWRGGEKQHKKANKEDKMQEVFYSIGFFLLNKIFDFKT